MLLLIKKIMNGKTSDQYENNDVNEIDDENEDNN